MRTWLFILLGSGAWLSVRGIQSTDQEMAVVIQALVDELATRATRDSVVLFHRLVPETADAIEFEPWLENLLAERYRARVPTDLFRQYWLANKSPPELSAIAMIDERPVRVVRSLRETTLPLTGGVHSVSRVGFTATGDSALVTVMFACRGLCGSRDLFLYVRTSNGWERRRNLVSMVH